MIRQRKASPNVSAHLNEHCRPLQRCVFCPNVRRHLRQGIERIPHMPEPFKNSERGKTIYSTHLHRKSAVLLFIIVFIGGTFKPTDPAHCADHNSGKWQKTSESVFHGLSALISVDSFLVAGSFGGGVFLTTDDGLQWIGVNTGLGGNNDLSIRCLARKGDILFAGTDGNGVYRMNITDKVWQHTSDGIPNDTIVSESDTSISGSRIFGIGISGNIILAGTADWHGLYRSNDDGRNWAPSGLQDKCVTTFGQFDNLVLAGTCGRGGIYESVDNGLSWRLSLQAEVTYGFVEMNGVIFAGTNHGVFKTVDSCRTWNQANHGLPKHSVNAITVSDRIVFVGGQNMGVYCSTNAGQDWVDFNEGLPKNVTVYALTIHNNKVFAGTHKDGVWQRDISDVQKRSY